MCKSADHQHNERTLLCFAIPMVHFLIRLGRRHTPTFEAKKTLLLCSRSPDWISTMQNPLSRFNFELWQTNICVPMNVLLHRRNPHTTARACKSKWNRLCKIVNLNFVPATRAFRRDGNDWDSMTKSKCEVKNRELSVAESNCNAKFEITIANGVNHY